MYNFCLPYSLEKETTGSKTILYIENVLPSGIALVLESFLLFFFLIL